MKGKIPQVMGGKGIAPLQPRVGVLQSIVPDTVENGTARHSTEFHKVHFPSVVATIVALETFTFVDRQRVPFVIGYEDAKSLD